MIYHDTLCFNMDRHTKNYGVLHDVQTGKVSDLAPNFDNNIVLFSKGYPKNAERKNDKLIELFLELLEKESKAIQYFNEMDCPKIDRQLIFSVVRKCLLKLMRTFYATLF